MANVYRQDYSRGVISSPPYDTVTFSLPSAVASGDLLVALVSRFSRTVIGDSAPTLPSISFNTPGVLWLHIASADPLFLDSWGADGGWGAYISTFDVYACFSSPAFGAGGCSTTFSVGGGYHSGGAYSSGANCHIFDFTAPNVTAAVSIVKDSRNGTETSRIYPLTVGPITTVVGDLVIIAADQAVAYNSGAECHPPVGFSGFGSAPYLLNSPGGSIDTTFTASAFGDNLVCGYTAIAIAFGGGVGIGTGGCGSCAGPHLLQLIPGFSDLPNSMLAADDPAFALHVGEIAFNATFGMVRCEVFVCAYKHGDTVALPRSCSDGYQYSREELIYLWAVQNSTDPSTNWISGPDSLWFMNWNVNQTTGEVFCEEWYERSSGADSRMAAKSNDGLLMVFTIAQRQKSNMIMAEAASYSSISESGIAIDKPLTEALIQSLNQDAKFACINSEVFYLGEYVDGDTVDLPISPVDGYEYSAGECQFLHAWRWTSSENSYIQPPGNLEQAAPFQASIDSSGVVSISVTFSTNGGTGITTPANYGRIAAFAFCTRSDTPGSGTLADDFTELPLEFFSPGRTVRASELLTIKRNIDEAILSPEFFGPTDYHDADTVSLPTSPVDGYAYARSEVQYIWSWSDTTNNAGGTHIRLPLFLGSVDPATGVVKLRCWRLPPGGPFVDDENDNAIISVLVMATRQATHPQLTLGATDANAPSDGGTFVADESIVTINGA